MNYKQRPPPLRSNPFSSDYQGKGSSEGVGMYDPVRVCDAVRSRIRQKIGDWRKLFINGKGRGFTPRPLLFQT